MEDKRFTSVLHNDQHVLFHLLPDHNNCTYNLRPRRHELVLAIKGDARNFIERQLFKESQMIYSSDCITPFLLYIVYLRFIFSCFTHARLRFVSRIFKHWTELNWAPNRTTAARTSLLCEVWETDRHGWKLVPTGADVHGVQKTLLLSRSGFKHANCLLSFTRCQSIPALVPSSISGWMQDMKQRQ